MFKKNFFYISLILIYLLYLAKDSLFNLPSLDNLTNYTNTILESYYEKEYNNLSTMLNIPPNNYNIEYSKVLIENLYDFYNTVTIKKGKNHNISKGYAVINDQGLIGIINKTTNNSSEVSLLTNPNTNISVKINDSYGILTSVDNKLIVKNIKLNNEIKENDLVYTSGLTEIPSDIIIGTVSDIKKDNLELEYIIEVNSAVDFYHLSYVGVIIP